VTSDKLEFYSYAFLSLATHQLSLFLC